MITWIEVNGTHMNASNIKTFFWEMGTLVVWWGSDSLRSEFPDPEKALYLKMCLALDVQPFEEDEDEQTENTRHPESLHPQFQSRQQKKETHAQERQGQEMNKITFEKRREIYTQALIAYGDTNQIIKCLEELAECQQAICKIVLGGENFDHLAEEVADATIMLEQMRLLFNINGPVCEYMDAKVKRLANNLEKRHLSCT